MPPRGLDVAHVFLLTIVQPIDPRQHVTEPQDAVQRRPQLVAHRGQEIVLELVHLVQAEVRAGEFFDLAIQAGVDRSQFILRGDEVPQHAVVGMAEFFELVARADVGPLVQVAVGDRIGHFLQVQHRLDDDVPHDEVRDRHGQKASHQSQRNQQGVVACDLRLRIAQWKGELGHRHQFPQVKIHQLSLGRTHLTRCDCGTRGSMTGQARLSGADRLKILVLFGHRVLVNEVRVALLQPPQGFIFRLFAGSVLCRCLIRPGRDELPVVFPQIRRLQICGQRLDQRLHLRIVGRTLQPVCGLQVLRNEQLRPLAVLGLDDGQVPLGVPVEAPGDQDDERTPEQETTLAFQAGFTEQSLQGAIRHGAHSQIDTPPEWDSIDASCRFGVDDNRVPGEKSHGHALFHRASAVSHQLSAFSRQPSAR